MTPLQDSLARVVESYETLVRDLMEAEKKAYETRGEPLTNWLYGMRWAATLMQR